MKRAADFQWNNAFCPRRLTCFSCQMHCFLLTGNDDLSGAVVIGYGNLAPCLLCCLSADLLNCRCIQSQHCCHCSTGRDSFLHKNASFPHKFKCFLSSHDSGCDQRSILTKTQSSCDIRLITVLFQCHINCSFRSQHTDLRVLCDIYFFVLLKTQCRDIQSSHL